MTLFDPFNTEVLDNPYPFYAELRAVAPVLYLEDYDIHVVSRYDDLMTIKRDPGTYASNFGMGVIYPAFLGGGPAATLQATGVSVEDVRRSISELVGDAQSTTRGLVTSDPPLHTHLRRMVTKPFLPRVIARLEPRIREHAERLAGDLIDASENGTVDLASLLTYPLPVIVIAEMLGIPGERWEDFKRWSNDGLSAGTGNRASDLERRARSMSELHDFFEEIVDDRRKNPGDDLVSMLVETTGRGDDPLDTEELIAFAQLLLVAGNETTTNLLSNLLFALFNHPDAMQSLRNNPSLIASAAEEAMRFDAPVQALFRNTTREVELCGVTLPERAGVMMLYGSANRDERHYLDADQFLVDRHPTDHTGFGHGIHFCLGAPLARLETRIAIETLLCRTRTIELAGEPVRHGNPVFRGMSYLPVELTRA